jgi:hypothetical protein
MGSLAAVLIAACLLAWAPASHADSNADLDFGPESAGYMALGVADLALGIAGGVFAIGNWASAVRGETSPQAWQIGGYLTGSLNLAAGVAWLVVGLADADHPKELFLVAGAHALIGALDLGLTIYSSKVPDDPLREVRLEPLVMSDLQGKPVCGAGLRMLNW